MGLLQQVKLPRRITVNDANPGLTITQSGAGRVHSWGADSYITSNLLRVQFVQPDYLQAYVKIQGATNGIGLEPLNGDGNYLLFGGRDSGVGMVEIARLASAVDPYFQMGRDDTGVATGAVTDMVKFQGGAGTNNEAANFGLGTSWLIGNAASEVEERGSIDLVLVTATNGSEDAKFNVSIMGGGAMVANLFGFDKTGLTILNTATEPASTANQATMYCLDLSVGNASIGFATEHATAASVATASTHKWGIRINGATYYVLLSNV